MNAVLYIHGKDGSPTESEHYKPLFPDCDVIGLDYQKFTPWETGKEIHDAITELNSKNEIIIIIANSIGAFFTMSGGVDELISLETIKDFTQKHNATLTVMEDG